VSTANTGWDRWVRILDEREKLFLERPPLDTIERKNVHVIERVLEGLVKKCGDPFCRWPIRHVRDRDYTAPFHGEICATCHDLYSALTIMNPFLKNTKYFYDAHDAWVKEIKAYKEKRKTMGLDENGIA